MSIYIIIGCGGALGAIMRIALSKILPFVVMGIPLPILTINIIGCFLIGFLTEIIIAVPISENWKYFLVPGFLGGFTTFSSFALEADLLIRKNDYFPAVIYISLSVFGSLIVCFLGMRFGRIFF